MSLSYVAQANDHQQLEWIGGSVMKVLLDGAATDGQLTVVRILQRRGDATPLHVHTHEDEVFVVLRGSATFWSGEDRHDVGEGGVVFLPRDIPHAYRISSESADLLTLCTPSGIEGFFRTAGRDLRTPRPKGWAITTAAMARASACHGQRVVGPPRTA